MTAEEYQDMTAEEFIHGLKRMCEYYGSRCRKGEDECPLINRACVTSKSLSNDMIGIVKDWVKKHPEKTRQSEFLKLFPNAELRYSAVNICLHKADVNFVVDCRETDCDKCCKEFWSKEIE